LGGKEPLFRIVRIREENETRGILLRILAVVAALLAGGIFLLALGHQPLEVYAAMWKGSFGSVMSTQGTVKIAIPLLINALAVSLAFKMKFWNIGTEGQMIVVQLPPLILLCSFRMASFCVAWSHGRSGIVAEDYTAVSCFL
jgi:simple sugar transport system permease protein